MESLSQQPEPAAPQTNHMPVQQVVYTMPPKDKTAAVLLAVFLSFWTWLYTYRKDAWKFWVGLGVTLGLIVLILPTLFATLFILPFWAFAVWLWALIDVATKPPEYYLHFYNS